MIKAMWEATKTLACIIGIGLVYATVLGIVMVVGVAALFYSMWLAVSWALVVVWCLLVVAYKWSV